MIAAMPICEGRVAPLFDVAKHLLVIEYRRAREMRRSEVYVGQATLLDRLRILSDNGVDVLICEAVSAPLETLVAAEGIKIIHHICGPINPVLAAYMAGRLGEDAFAMPGCGGRHHRNVTNVADVQVKS
jgi:predicted Fe-Mo cluster-binding NifX family protein